MRRNNARFQRGSAVYTCRCCHKLTRETGGDESGVELCRVCYDSAGWTNAHYDGEHAEKSEPDCPLCQGHECFCEVEK